MPNLEKSTKTDAKSRIILYLTKGDILLTADEERILARWEHADFLMRQRVEMSDIILKHTLKFGVSKFTADNDIFTAQEVFGRSRKINKKYVGHLHLQDIEQDLAIIRKVLFTKDKDGNQLIPDGKEIMALAKLHDAYTRQLNALPDDHDHSDAQRPVIIFELAGAEAVKMPMDMNKALQLADRMINNQPLEDIDHEELPNSTDNDE